MPLRKKRIPVVLDTNVLIAYYLSRSPNSPNVQVVRLWREQRKLQLILSSELVAEYLGTLSKLHVQEERLRRFSERLKRRSTVTTVRLGARAKASRDPDDNQVIATAVAGKAKFLITNDRDLLDIPSTERKKLRFQILTPVEFLLKL